MQMKHRKATQRFTALIVCLLLFATTAFAAVPEKPNHSFVRDDANVLSSQTEQLINDLSDQLTKDCGAQLAVLTVDFTGSMSTADFATEAYNKWGVGDRRKDNGVLLLLAIGAEDYYCAVGEGLEDDLKASQVDSLLWQYLEPDFAKANYNDGVQKFANAMYDELAWIYDLDGAPQNNGPFRPHSPIEQVRPGRHNKLGTFIWLVVLLVLLLLVMGIRTGISGYGRRRWFNRYPGGYGSGYNNGYRNGYNAGQYNGRNNRNNYRSSGWSSGSSFGGGSSRGAGAGRRSSSGSSYRSSSRSSSSHSSSRSSFGGGSSRGAGAGRRK